jgi:hypothetical protein
MTQRQLRRLQNQIQVKVATPAQPSQANTALLLTFAFAAAGVFFFIGQLGWRVLTGG